MFWNLFKKEDKTVTNEEELKDKLWEDADVSWFLVSNNLSVSEKHYSVQDLINIKKAITKGRKEEYERNRNELYRVLKTKYDFEPNDTKEGETNE